jgi:hypothetical protein
MKVLMIVLLIAVIGLIGWMAVRSRSNHADALPAPDRPDEIGPHTQDEAAVAAPPGDIASMDPARPADPEPQVVAQSTPTIEPDPDVEPLPEPDPVVEPEPPVEPEPVIEPDDAPPVEPEPVVEPDTASVGSPAGDHPAADPDEPTDPPRAVIDAGEVAAKELDPEAGWESDDDTKVHADPESGLFHTPDSPGYKLGPDGQVFESEDAAREAGFTRWDEPA